MRTAICFSGQLRRPDLCLPTTLPLISQLGDCSVFYSGPDDPSEFFKFFPDAICQVEADNQEIGLGICGDGLSGPQDWTVPGTSGRSRNINDLGISLALQWYGVMQSFRLAYDTGIQFDSMCRLRTDLYFRVSPTLPTDLDASRIVLPSKYEYAGLCDRFAIGPPALMGVYSSFFDHLNDYMGSAEVRLRHWIETNGIPIEKTPIDFVHMGADGSLRYL